MDPEHVIFDLGMTCDGQYEYRSDIETMYPYCEVSFMDEITFMARYGDCEA
jgi:hypothetical protein